MNPPDLDRPASGGSWVIRFDNGTSQGIRVEADLARVVELLNTNRIGPLTAVLPPGATRSVAAAALPEFAEFFSAEDRANARIVSRSPADARALPNIGVLARRSPAKSLRFWAAACTAVAVTAIAADLVWMATILGGRGPAVAIAGSAVVVSLLGAAVATALLTLRAMATGLAELSERD